MLWNMLKAYIDEAGFDGPIFMFGGFLSTDDAWNRFDVKWQRLLDSPCAARDLDCKPEQRDDLCRLLPYLHAVEMQGLGQKRFKPIGQANRDYLVAESIKIILSSPIIGVTGGIEVSGFDSLADEWKKRFGSPYEFCLHYVLHRMAEKADMLLGASDEKITYVFDRQDIFGHPALDWCEKYRNYVGDELRLGPISFENKGEFKPLQAADGLVYEAFKKHANPSQPERPYWAQIVKSPMITGEHCSAPFLNRAVAFLEEDRSKRRANREHKGLFEGRE